jgi:hypothetical protein
MYIKSILIFLSFQILPGIINAQDSLAIKNSITINIGQASIGEIQVLYERKIKQSMGIEFGAGYRIPNNAKKAVLSKEYNRSPDYQRMPLIGFAESFYTSLSLKKYIDASANSYLSFGVFYRNWNYRDKIIISGSGLSSDPMNYIMKGSANLNILGVKALVGTRLFQIIDQHFIVDGFIGLSIRYKIVDLHNEYFHPTYGNGPQIDIPYRSHKELWQLSIQAGVKIGLGW